MEETLILIKELQVKNSNLLRNIDGNCRFLLVKPNQSPIKLIKSMNQNIIELTEVLL